MSKNTETGFDSLPVAGTEEEDFQDIAQTLVRELDLQGFSGQEAFSDLSQWLGSAENLTPAQLKQVGLDIAVHCGLCGDWKGSLSYLEKLVECGQDGLDVKIWMLRSLVESGRYAESLAHAQATPWGSRYMIHVNYLTGLAYEALGMRQQAQLRFEAVRRQDSDYKDIRFR